MHPLSPSTMITDMVIPCRTTSSSGGTALVSNRAPIGYLTFLDRTMNQPL